MTTSGPTPPAEPRPPAVAEERPNQGQWALIVREFRKRRLAVISLWIIALLVTTSVFAPFLANDRPITYVGFNRFDYSESFRTIRALLNELAAADEDAVRTPEETRAIIGVHLSAMAGQVDDETSASLKEFRTQLNDALELEDQESRSGNIRALQSEMRSRFGPRNAEFVSRRHYPVIASLTMVDAGFMALNLLFLTAPLWRWVVRRVVRSANPLRTQWRVTLALFFVLPLASALIWKSAVPERVDRTRYKQFADAADSEGTAQVHYESVVWPPIPYGLDEDNLDAKHLPPAWWDTADAAESAAESPSVLNAPHWLGTDGIGRDILCRMIWGGRVSLAVGIVAVSIYVTIGVIVGSIAGYFRGAADIIISRVIEVVICFPSFFLILTIIAFIGPSIFNIMAVIGLIGWTGVARLVRGEFLRLGEQDFVQAGRALGYKPHRIIFRHVLPNAMAPVLVAATFGIAGAILTESGLSFLGFGITVPTPSWGGILSNGRENIFRAPWMIYFPGFAIFITITCYNLVGEAFRDAADPRLRDGGRA